MEPATEWSGDIRTDNYASQGTEILYAFDASNVATLLYSSGLNIPRDNPGSSVKFRRAHDQQWKSLCGSGIPGEYFLVC